MLFRPAKITVSPSPLKVKHSRPAGFAAHLDCSVAHLIGHNLPMCDGYRISRSLKIERFHENHGHRFAAPESFVEQKPLVLSTHSITTATRSCRVFRLRFRAMWQHCRNPRVKGGCQAPTDVSQQPPDRQCGVSRSRVCSTIAPTASRKELLSVTDDTPRERGCPRGRVCLDLNPRVYSVA
jgi:hypothetical protein